MNRKKFVIISVFVVLVTIIILLYFRFKSNLEASTFQTQAAPPVEISTPVRGNLVRKLTYTGDILPIQQVSIYSRVNGNIKGIYADIGDYVRKGRLLAEIDRSIYSQNVLQSRALYKQAQATALNNKQIFARNQDLFEKGLISREELDNSETALHVSNAQIESAEANLNNAITQLSYCGITAPFNGYITKRFLDNGAYVSTGGQSQSSVLFILSEINQLKILVNVSEKDMPSLDSVKEVTVRTDTYPDKIFNGTVKRQSQQFDLNTRTMAVEVDLENDDNLLKPGMFANVEVIIGKSENTILLPAQCVQNDEKGSFLFKVGEDSVAHKVYVATGIKDKINTEIISGITEDDKVLTTGYDIVKEGMKVKIKKSLK
jgi:RND family efflux transporter MFP subunit